VCQHEIHLVAVTSFFPPLRTTIVDIEGDSGLESTFLDKPSVHPVLRENVLPAATACLVVSHISVTTLKDTTSSWTSTSYPTIFNEDGRPLFGGIDILVTTSMDCMHSRISTSYSTIFNENGLDHERLGSNVVAKTVGADQNISDSMDSILAMSRSACLQKSSRNLSHRRP